MPSNIDNQLVQPENLNDEALLAANVLLFDAMVRHQVFLMRLNGSLRNETEKLLNATEEDIANLILVRLHGVKGATPRNLAIVALLISDIRKLRHGAWTEVRTLWRSTLGELTESEVRFLATALETSLPVEYDAVPPVDKVSTAAKALPFEGQTLSQWSNRIEEEDLRRIAQQIRIGLVQGEPARVIAARVIGTARMRGRNGVTQITRRRADAIVRTAIIHFSNVARTAFLAANEEMFSEEMYVATLDSRTTPICRSLDGNTYPLGEGPMPPIHWNCRSLRVPRITPDAVGSRQAKAVTEAMLVREYARKNGLKRAKHQKDIPVGQRVDYERFARRRTRELTAIVPAKQTYGEWLARQSAEFQNDTLGISKARLFRKGGLTLDKFVNRRGDELTLAQLAQREAVAFRAAGLDPGDYR